LGKAAAAGGLGSTLMSAAPTLLGAMAGGKGSGQRDATQTMAPWSEQQPYLQNLFGGAQDWLQDPQRQQGTDLATQYAGGALPGLIDQTQQGLGQMLSATPNMDVWGPVMDAAMTRPIQAFQEQVLPGIRTGAQQTGQYGSSRQGIAEGLAAGRLGQTLSDTQARLTQYAGSEALGQRKAGMAMAPGIAGLGMMPSQITEQAGLGPLQAYKNLVGGNYGGSQTTPYFGNPAMGALGGGMLGSQLGSMFSGGKGGGDLTSPSGLALDYPGSSVGGSMGKGGKG